MPAKRICEIFGCDKPHQSRGWCKTHYQRWLVHGDPNFTKNGRPAAFIRDVALSYDEDSCLCWPFAKTGSGRGMLWWNGKNCSAHRLVCTLTQGPPPSPHHMAIHSCGNGHLGCVNPRHLRWGTALENSADAISHGVIRRGSNHPISKLTEHDVAVIRTLIGKKTKKEIARMFGVSKTIIRNIEKGIIWRHVD